MKITKIDGYETVDNAIKKNEPLMAVIAFDGKEAFVSHIDDGVEHHILLQKAGIGSNAIDKYFRIIFDKDGADWTFVCPPDYCNIKDRTRRISQFYKDGFTYISEFLCKFGYLVEIKIPHRYRRHLDALGE